MITQQMRQAIVNYMATQPIKKAWVFGSFARNEETPESDVDLLVEFDHSEPIGLFRYVGMRLAIEDLIGRKVDLVEEGALRPAAAITANKDKKMIYERTY